MGRHINVVREEEYRNTKEDVESVKLCFKKVVFEEKIVSNPLVI